MDGDVMSNCEFRVSSFKFREVSDRSKRRRALCGATTLAALALAGCGMLAQPADTPTLAQRQLADQKVKQYQSDIELALDNVDRDRLRAAAETKAATMPAKGPSQAPVILASSTGGQTPAVGAGSGWLPARGTAPVKEAAPGPAGMPRDAGPSAVVPWSVEPSLGGVVVMPLSGEPARTPSAEMAPFMAPAMPSASAMGAMSALVPPAQMAAAEPPAAGASGEASLDEALAVLRKSVAEHPSLNTVMALALLDGSKGGEALKKLPEADQKVVGDLLAAIDVMKVGTAGATVADRAAPLMEAAKHWQQDADLALPRMVLATRVDSFGVFTPVSGTFEQGKRHTVIIYCEVANFASKKSDDGWYTTNLSQQETLITDDGLLVWRPNAEDVEDRSMNQRHDFYLVKKLTIPETLAAGKYTLRMSVTDRNTNKISVVSMPVEIVMK
jgi:hypothetical protein